MLKNYFKTAWRNLSRNKFSSFINIGGLAIGMSVSILIGLWTFDELNYDKYHKNYERIAQVMQHQNFNGQISTQGSNPAVMAAEIRRVYGSNFKYVLQSSWNNEHTLTYGDKMILQTGSYFEPQVADMLSLKMLKGSANGLYEMNAILLSETVARAYFGKEDPINKVLKVDNKVNVKVTGVYEDLPNNTSFKEVKFMLPWALYLSQNDWIAKMDDPWNSNFTQTFVQIADNADMQKVSAKIRNVKLNKIPKDERRYNPVVFLHPMHKWHLYSDFIAGVNTGGQIDNVWLFGIIGLFVLLLACINFMNLSTARSEKRAKEVGIRKAIGAERRQLIMQFFSESVVISTFAFLFALLLVLLMLPYFNAVAGKQISILWSNPLFWFVGIGFSIITGLVAGVYPALFLSSFQSVKVLKGTFRVGRNASLPRKVLVVLQFTISIILAIGTMVVYKQINHAKGRSIGYSRDGLIAISSNEETHKNFEAMRLELKSAGAITEMAESGSPITEVYNTNGGFDWEGKDPNLAVDFPNNSVTYEYGKTIGWQITEGRDFSREFATDSSAFILNESAVKFIGLKNPVGKTIRWEDKPFTVVGVVKDILVQSPYLPVRPSMFHISGEQQDILIIKMNPSLNTKEALRKIEAIIKKYNPATPFSAKFTDEEFAKKFGNEERIGKLATFFAILALLISSLGLFGLASFVAEQRTKEIGIRKVLGATVTMVWQMLSKEFVFLVLISCVIAVPTALYVMTRWLQKYEYRTSIPWWVFALACTGVLVITLLTVSYQAIKAAIANPIKSLRSE